VPPCSPYGITPREAALVVWALAACGRPSRALLAAAMAAYGDVWTDALGYFDMARLVNAFARSGFYPWDFVNRVSRPGGGARGVGGWAARAPAPAGGLARRAPATAALFPPPPHPAPARRPRPPHPRRQVVALFLDPGAEGSIAPDTLALMTEGLALLDHVPGTVWMENWIRLACERIAIMTPPVRGDPRRAQYAVLGAPCVLRPLARLT
jgi:hypothetical protein